MSTFTVPVVVIGKIDKHPNADSLSVTQVEGCPVIFRTGDFQTGDQAVYVPVDAVVPLENKVFEFLGNKPGQKLARVKAKRLRGIFSMGLLVKPADAGVEHHEEGLAADQDLSTYLGIVKYEEATPPFLGGEMEKDPGFMPVYDMESYRKFKSLLVPGESVVVTEKIHGTNARFGFKDGTFYVGTHRTFRRRSEDNMWWRVAEAYGLEEKLRHAGENLVFYGEIYGQVQDLKYGTKPGEVRLAFFDIFDSSPENRRWLSYWEQETILKNLDLPLVPVLYRGPYEPDLIEPMAEGKSTLADCIREGWVIRPLSERWNGLTGRTVLKLVGQQYLLRKSGTEHH